MLLFLMTLLCFINLSYSAPQQTVNTKDPDTVNYFVSLHRDLDLRPRCNIKFDTLAPNYTSVLIPCDRRIPSSLDVDSLHFEFDFQIFLCMGVYDSILHFCDLENKPETAIQEFFAPQSDVPDFCSKLKKTLEVVNSSYTQTKQWVMFLKQKLNEVSVCNRVCFGSKNDVNPLCSFIYGVYTFIASNIQGNGTGDIQRIATKDGPEKKAIKGNPLERPADTHPQHNDQPSSQPLPPPRKPDVPQSGQHAGKKEDTPKLPTLVNNATIPMTQPNSDEEIKKLAPSKNTMQRQPDAASANQTQLHPATQHTDPNKEDATNPQKPVENLAVVIDPQPKNLNSSSPEKQEPKTADTPKPKGAQVTSQALKKGEADPLTVPNSVNPPQDPTTQDNQHTSVSDNSTIQSQVHPDPVEVKPPETHTQDSQHNSVSGTSAVQKQVQTSANNPGANIGVQLPSEPEKPEEPDVPPFDAASGDIAAGEDDGMSPGDTESEPHFDGDTSGDRTPVGETIPNDKSTVGANDKSTIDVKDHNSAVGPNEGVIHGNQMTEDTLVDAEYSNFYMYFVTMVVLCIIGYLAFHNKQKILALTLEGHSRRNSRRRRPNTTKYKKLDSNLEEAVTSSCKQSTTSVIY